MDIEERKVCPIGISNFDKLRRGGYFYIDKTYLIQRLLDKKENVVLFTRPRRFGKTLALSMLRRFFDCNAAEQNRSLFDGLIVAESEHHMAEQGQYPVIYITLKDAKGTSLASLLRYLHRAFIDALVPFDYLTQSERLSGREQAIMEQLMSSLVPNSAATLEILDSVSASLGFICSMLAKHHGKPVVVLIDEYDTPLQSAYLHGFYQTICDLMRNLFSSALKDNECLRLGVLTGVLRIAKESLFSGLNNLKVDTILSKNYADCFGFTQAEVDSLADYYGAGDKKEEIKEWYDGYRFGELDIYNPWSVLQYFESNCEPKAYWLDTSSNDLTKIFLKRLVKSPDSPVVQLSQGGTVIATVDSAISYDQLETQAAGDSEADYQLYSLMAVTGYLKPVERERADRYNLKIPNREVRTIYAAEILSYLEQGLNIGKLALIGDAIVQGQGQRFMELLNKYMTASMSYYDTVEAFYHGWLMGLLLILDEDYYCKSNREAGNGRADVMLTPRSGCKGPGIIFEFKYGDKPEQLPSKAEEALQQIEERRYIEEFPLDSKEVFGYGMSFCAKECNITHKVWKR